MEIERSKTMIELTAYYTWMGDDGIARTKVKPGADITLVEATENSVAVNGLFKDKKFPLLVDARNIHSITKDARAFFSISNRESNVKAFAIIIDSPISKIIGNFFMSLNKPSVPARLFVTEEAAVNWLKRFL